MAEHEMSGWEDFEQLVLLSDGRIAARGRFRPGVAVFRPDGRLDESFGYQGYALLEDTRTHVGSLAAGKDGGLYLFYTAWTRYDDLPHKTKLVALDKAGKADKRFGNNGFLLPSYHEGLSGGVLLGTPDGKLLYTDDTMHTEKDPDFSLFRLLPNGKPDSNFGRRGAMSYYGSNHGLNQGGDLAIFARADGSWIVAGSSAKGYAPVVRFDADGRQDSAFSANCRKMDLDYPEGHFHDAVLRSDGGIVLAGGTAHGDNDGSGAMLLVALQPDGSPDATFGKSGRVVKDLSSVVPETRTITDPETGRQRTVPDVQIVRDNAHGVAMQADGKILVTGSLVSNRESFGYVARFTQRGDLDPSFGTEGISKISQFFPYDLILSEEGRIIVAGSSSGRPALIALVGDRSSAN